MSDKERRELEGAVLDTIVSSLEAQLRAVRRLRENLPRPRRRSTEFPSKSSSQLDYVFDVLQKSGRELHVNEIIERVRKMHGIELERESIVSALSKKIRRGERFTRTDKNVFGLLPE